MAIDLVVVNYHTPEDLDRFLASLEANPPIGDATLTIVEVDSEDYTHEFTWDHGRRSGQTIGTATNVGYGIACNLAATHGSLPHVAFFNADVEVTAGAIDACVQALYEHPECAALGPRQVDSARRIRHAGIFGVPTAPRHRGWNEIDVGQYLDVLPAVTVSGSAYFVRRHVWDELTNCARFREVAPEALGAFLPTPHYYEETWFSYHARAHGYEVLYFGQATVIHQWHRASPVGGWAEQQMPVSREYFRAACDHHGIPHD